MLSAIAEMFSIWLVVAMIGAVTFAAFANSQKKLMQQQVRRHGRFYRHN